MLINLIKNLMILFFVVSILFALFTIIEYGISDKWWILLLVSLICFIVGFGLLKGKEYLENKGKTTGKGGYS